MPQCWVISPVDTVGGGRRPAVGLLPDLGIPPYFATDDSGAQVQMRKRLGFVAAIAGHSSPLALDRCLVLVGGVSLASLNGESEIEVLTDPFGDDYFLPDRYIDRSPVAHGWNASRRSNLGARLAVHGVDVRGLTDQTDFETTLNRISRLFTPGFKARVAKGRV